MPSQTYYNSASYFGDKGLILSSHLELDFFALV